MKGTADYTDYTDFFCLCVNRLKGELLPRARMLLGQVEQVEKPSPKSWRERMLKFTGEDPLICKNCSLEMNLIFTCFCPVENELLSELEFKFNDKIPSMQFKLIPDTS